MITVKHLSIHTGHQNTRLHEYMLPKGGAWGGCRFDFSPECRKYDWLVVFDDLPRQERLACPRENTMLVITEPATVKVYPNNFLRQFGVVVDPQTRGVNRHPNIKHYPVIWNWAGGLLKTDGKPMGYEDMLNMPPPQKSKWLSVMCSNKIFTDFHYRRFEFCTRFARENPHVDFYGAGIRPIDDKADVLLPHRFHLAVENLRAHDYWTEKLAESYLAYCFTAYCGCVNLADYFPLESVMPVDIGDYDSAVAMLKSLDETEYNRRIEAVREARHLLLTKHHPAKKIAAWIDESENLGAENDGVIRPREDCVHTSMSVAVSYWLKRQRHEESRQYIRTIRRKMQRVRKKKIVKEMKQ